jgi:hypothetical protein
MMLPGENMKKMKTFQSMDPMASSLNKETLNKFIEYQNLTLDILNDVKQYNLSKLKTGITISNWIKLRLGDTLRVVIYHNMRHVDQAKAVVSSLKLS